MIGKSTRRNNGFAMTIEEDTIIKVNLMNWGVRVKYVYNVNIRGIETGKT